ncbi:MAG: manganese catalase family protein [Hyphomicrobiaceae bacterium]|nr:manganese catalase family protein [Hyphomicrobiaceae bacterium]
MFHHVKELQLDVRVSEPDPRFARLLLEQFGGGNGELKAAMQYFTQAFGCRRPYPDKYDLLMDIATEEFSHLEIVGALITLLLDGVNAEMKNAVERSSLAHVMNGKAGKEAFIHEALTNPQFLVLSGGGPTVTDSVGTPWSGSYVNANGDLSVDLRSNIAAESRAKIVYEYLMQLTDDNLVKDALRFLMTREVAHFQMFAAALDTIQPNFPPGVLQGDPRFTHTYFNMSAETHANGQRASAASQGETKGPWNEGAGPWDQGEWAFIEDPIGHVRDTAGLTRQEILGSAQSMEEVDQLDEQLARERSKEVAGKPRGKGKALAF